MTALAVEAASVSPEEPGVKRLQNWRGFDAVLRWEAESGVRCDVPSAAGLSVEQLGSLASFLTDVRDSTAPDMDFEFQMAGVPLAEMGLVKVSMGPEFHCHEGWVSESAEQPVAFGTPVLGWSRERDYQTGRPKAVLSVDAVGLEARCNPLRMVAAWNDAAGIEALVQRAHAVDTYQVEIALVDSDAVRSARQRWMQKSRAEEFAAGLTRAAHVKHSRLARILKAMRDSREGENRWHRGYLYVIDVPGTKIVPVIALRRFDGAAIRQTLANEGLTELGPLSDSAFWDHQVVRTQLSFWVADPALFDPADTALVGWLENMLSARCLTYQTTRAYPL